MKTLRWKKTDFIAPMLCAMLAGCAQSRFPAAQAPQVYNPALVNIPIGHFNGSPQEMGAEHGRRFHDQIINLFQNYLLPQLPGNLRIQAHLAAALFELYMLPDQRAEVTALAGAVGLNIYDAMLAQCYLDLMPITGCSTISLPAGASPDGVARMGRNLDFNAQGILDRHSVLMIYRPAEKYQFAAIGWPGMIGVLSGMNEYGLCLANMEVDRTMRSPDAMPYTLLYRTILERCRTVDEAIDLLNRTPRQSANNLMLMDASGNRAVAEIRPEDVTVRRGTPGSALISTNHQRGQDADTAGRCWRYDSLHRAAITQYGNIDIRSLERMLSRVVQGQRGEMTIQSMVFEPRERVIFLATGLDAPQQRFERIDLKFYFDAASTSN
jgi:isopenicillin-N N-acyltransferase like protein